MANKDDLNKVIKALKDRRIEADYVNNADQAREKVSALVSICPFTDCSEYDSITCRD